MGDINDVLEQECLECWILFDKIDELFSDDYGKRKICIESLFRTYLSFVNRFPRIKFKIFLRNDIWSTLEFVNKSHLSDKNVVLSWDKKDLLIMLMRRCLDNEMVEWNKQTRNILNICYLNFSVHKQTGCESLSHMALVPTTLFSAEENVS